MRLLRWETPFMAKQKWITKKEIATILKMYSVRTDEFQPFNNDEHCYTSKYTHGYMISITHELQHSSEKQAVSW